MQFQRVYAPIAQAIAWKTVDVAIRDGKTGKTIFSQQAVEVPDHWSDNAAQILASKYFRKAGVPLETISTNDPCAKGLHRDRRLWDWLWPRRPVKGTTFAGETSAKQVFHRLAGCWTYWGWRSGLLTDETQAKAFYDEAYAMLALQIAAPNSPQWFNTGLYWAYGIKGPESGQWAIDYGATDRHAALVFQTNSSYEYPQPHACFIQPVADDLVNPGGIMDLWIREVRLFKHGSGTGTNFSNVRAKGERLSGGGISSGLMSFLRIGDQAAGSIKSGGVTRRAAKMVVLDMDHPEIADFIAWKAREERKALAMHLGSKLLAESDNGEVYDADWEGEAINSVSGQNSNNSVRVTDDFLDRVDADDDWELTARTDGSTMEVVKAKDLWDRLCQAAHASADPGVQFSDTINRWHTCAADGKINSSNPCSEYMFLDDTACNLASLNLVAFLDDGEIDLTKLTHAARLWTVVLDISVQMASFPSREIALGSYNYRTLGLGYANLGALLMRLALPYDSDQGRALAAATTALMHFTALRTSNEMAGQVGAFPRYDANKATMGSVVELHKAALSQIPCMGQAGRLFLAAVEQAEAIVPADGFRNAQVTLLAPTGTISFVMDCDTTGIEPDYALVKHKNLAGGGHMTIVNQSIDPALAKLGYDRDVRQTILRQLEQGVPLAKTYMSMVDHAVFACVNELDPMAHVKMVAAVQPFLSGAVSKTVNLPNGATVAEVDKVYRQAHRLGLKAVALYRDGSKLTQPLASAKPTKEPIRLVPRIEPLEEDGPAPPVIPSREMMPWRRSHAWTQKVKIDGNSVYLHVSEYPDGRPGEIFLELAHQGSTLRALGNLFAIAVSIGLQHRVPLEAYIKNFLHTRFEPAGIVEGHDQIKMVASIADYVARELAITYLGRDDLANIKNGNGHGYVAAAEPMPPVTMPPPAAPVVPAKVAIGFDIRPSLTGDLCPQCHNATLRRTGTCVACAACDYNTGCG